MEFGLALWLRGLTIGDYLATRDPVSGTVYYLLLALFAVMPLLLTLRLTRLPRHIRAENTHIVAALERRRIRHGTLAHAASHLLDRLFVLMLFHPPHQVFKNMRHMINSIQQAARKSSSPHALPPSLISGRPAHCAHHPLPQGWREPIHRESQPSAVAATVCGRLRVRLGSTSRDSISKSGWRSD